MIRHFLKKGSSFYGDNVTSDSEEWKSFFWHEWSVSSRTMWQSSVEHNPPFIAQDFQESRGKLLRIHHFSNALLILFIRSLAVQADVVIWGSVRESSLLVSRSMQVILRNAVKLDWFSRYSMACQHHSFPLCFCLVSLCLTICQQPLPNSTMCCCVLDAKQHWRFPFCEYHHVMNDTFCSLFQIQITRLMSNSNEWPLSNDTSDDRLYYFGSIMALSPLKTIKYHIFSIIEIVFLLFQTALRYHQWSEWLWTWHLQSSKTFDLSLQWGVNDELRKWKSDLLLTSFVTEMLWKIIKLGR